jgi:glyoxylase-like metal-dependent hydrolase (beta-lactamase superfamily II)
VEGSNVIVESSRDSRHLANAYIVGDEPGGRAVIVDAGAPIRPLLEALTRHRLEPTHLLCTHGHFDHVEHVAELRRRFGLEVCAHRLESIAGVDRALDGGERLTTGRLEIRALHVPGHTAGGLAFLVDGEQVFVGDTLFRRSVGGTRGPRATTFEDLRRSVLDGLLRLPDATIVQPGHMEPTTIGEEREQNPFIRAWLGLERPAERRCRVGGQDAVLLLRAADYDGGTKCWVRFPDGTLAVVAGSKVSDG